MAPLPSLRALWARLPGSWRALAACGLGGALLATVLEVHHRQGLEAARAWLALSPLQAGLTAGLGGLVAFAFLALVGRAGLALACTAGLFAMMGHAHATKQSLLGKPLFPWDVLLSREAIDLLPYALSSRTAIAALALSLAAASAIVSHQLRRPGAGLPARAVAALVFGAACWVLAPAPSAALQRLGVTHIKWQQADNYRVNGLILSFTMNLGSAAIRAPSDYGRSAVKSAAARAEPPRRAPAPPPERPTVLLVMSESFFDPTRLPGLTFSEDPLPHLHRLQAAHLSGVLYTPVYGGGTANTEFEVLTGHSTRLLPVGSVPYQQYVRRRQRSLASLFKAQGYRTAAVHTYYRWFWEREQVYQHLGFEHFTGAEDMPDAVIDGKYLSDASLTAEVLRELDRADARPAFLFAVSMEAHGPYEAGRYATEQVQVDGPLDEPARAALSTWVEAARHADRELGALVEHLSRSDKPVLLFFFGDHQPSLPAVLSQLGVAGSLTQLSLSQREQLHRVPLLVWSNRPLPSGALPPMSAPYLGPLVLELAGVEGTAYTEFLRHVQSQMPIVTPGLVSDVSGALHDETPSELEPLEQAWWTLQYDELFGEQLLDLPDQG